MHKSKLPYIAMVEYPGKFERESAFIPYLWESSPEFDDDATDQMIIDYCRDHNLDYGNGQTYQTVLSTLPHIYRIDILSDDIMIFPELWRVSHVFLWEDDQGFVYSEIVYHEAHTMREAFNIITKIIR